MKTADNLFDKHRDEIWIKYFNEKFVKGSTGVQHHLDIINQNYVPRLKGIKHFSFLAVK
tara:strand:+ start:352 stop:528 length:177 start_codon:yes stop_codon:yes gene_type:complete